MFDILVRILLNDKKNNVLLFKHFRTSLMSKKTFEQNFDRIFQFYSEHMGTSHTTDTLYQDGVYSEKYQKKSEWKLKENFDFLQHPNHVRYSGLEENFQNIFGWS